MDNFDIARYERSLERGMLDSFERNFDDDEDAEFLDNLCVILGDYLNPFSAMYWSQELKFFSEAWKTRAERRQYIEAALDRVAGMIVARGWDPTPLFWVTKYIGEYKKREASKVEEVFDLLQRLSIAITGKSSRWLRLYDEEITGQQDTPPPQPDDLSNELSVPERPQASENKLFPNGPPADDIAERCILHLFSRRDGSNADLDLLRDYFKGDIDRAKAMQVEIRRLRSEGVTTLLVNPNRVKRVKRP